MWACWWACEHVARRRCSSSRWRPLKVLELGRRSCSGIKAEVGREEEGAGVVSGNVPPRCHGWVEEVRLRLLAALIRHHRWSLMGPPGCLLCHPCAALGAAQGCVLVVVLGGAKVLQASGAFWISRGVKGRKGAPTPIAIGVVCAGGLVVFAQLVVLVLPSCTVVATSRLVFAACHDWS